MKNPKKLKEIGLVAISLMFSWIAVYGQSLNTPSASCTAEKAKMTLPQIYRANWKTNPFDRKIFIENMGQFDKVLQGNDKVYYGAELGEVLAYFTSDGLTYRYDEPLRHKTDREEENENAEYEASRKFKVHYMKIVWDGANPDVIIKASEKQSDYYVYPTGMASSMQVSLFKKITYQNLYPGIDVEYILPEGKEGLKYAIIVHPGADISKIKLRYIGANNLKKNNAGDVIINTEIGDFIDHAPISYYEGENENQIPTVNNVQGMVELFKLPNSYNKNKTIVIDPWIINPFAPFGRRGPWDIDYDYSGNVYAASIFGLVKINSAGVILWTYKGAAMPLYKGSPYAAGYEDFTVDRVTGNCFYVGLGSGIDAMGVIQKVSTSGGTMAVAFTPPNLAWEFWRVVWNPCTNQIIIGAGGTGGAANTYQAAITDVNLSAITIRNVMGVTFSNYDMVGIAIDRSGNSCYMANCQWRPTDNKLIKLPLPAFTPTLFNQPNGYLFREGGNHNMYAAPSGSIGIHNGMNIMAAGNNGVYMWDGYTLKQFNKTTGALNASNIVQPPVVIKLGANDSLIKTFWSGIDVDACEKIYAGYQTTIKVFNSSLSQINVINLPSNLDTVFDVAVGATGKTLYACGFGFVTSIDLSGPATDSISKTTTQATCPCDGTATATLNRCATPLTTGVTYLWSNGQTTQTATGLCAGIHNVTLTYNCVPYHDTVKISSPGNLTITQTQANVKCNGDNTGHSTVIITGGTSPYTYSWMPVGGSNATATNLAAGTYTCLVTDANGCKISTVITITESDPIISGGTSTNNSCTTTGSATAYVSTNGSYSFTWSNGTSGPTADGLIAGNYTVTVVDGNTCTQTRSFNITGVNPASAAFTVPPVCINQPVCFTHTGSAGTHAWSVNPPPVNVSGSTANFCTTFLTAATYTVTHTVSNAGCTSTIARSVKAINCSSPTVTAIGSSVCPGSCASITSSSSGGTGPYTYLWSNGANTQNINSCPVNTTTYTVTVTDSGGNTSTTTAVIVVNSPVNVTTFPTNTTCNGSSNGSVIAMAGGGTPLFTYAWSGGLPGSVSQVSGLSTGNYTVTVTDSKGCTATSSAAINSPTPLTGLFSKGSANCTGCGCKEWLMANAAGGTSPYRYTWPDGYVNRYRNQLCPGTYTVNVTDKNGCSINVNLTTP